MVRRKSNTRETLPEAELEILACLQQLGEAEAAQLRRRIRPQRPLTHASVVTLLGRLRTRGLVDRRKAETGKAYLYFPTPAAAETPQRILGRLLERVFHDNTVSMVSSLFGAKPPTRKQVEELREILDEIEATDAGRKDTSR